MLQLYDLHKYLGKKEMFGMQIYGVKPNLRAVECRFGCTKCSSIVKG